MKNFKSKISNLMYKTGWVKPIIKPPKTFLGSFPPYDEFATTGIRSDYFIHSGYKSRMNNDFFDDTNLENSAWQKEVYIFAKEICFRDNLKTVLDLGCGSGFKLLKYLGDLNTIGADLKPTYEYLIKKYPNRKWMISDFETIPDDAIDLVVAVDVIEHLPNPDLMLEYIKKINPKKIIISTPDRNLLLAGTHNGPPKNPAHVREWSYFELQKYVSSFFNIEEHFISSPAQATQCILCSGEMPKS